MLLVPSQFQERTEKEESIAKLVVLAPSLMKEPEVRYSSSAVELCQAIQKQLCVIVHVSLLTAEHAYW